MKRFFKKKKSRIKIIINVEYDLLSNFSKKKLKKEKKKLFGKFGSIITVTKGITREIPINSKIETNIIKKIKKKIFCFL